MAPSSDDFTPRYDDEDERKPRRAPSRGRSRDRDRDDEDDRPRKRRYSEDPVSTSGMAVASLVLGLLGFISCGFLGLIGVFLGVFALISISSSGGAVGGKGFAWGGLIAGLLSLAIPAALVYPVMVAMDEKKHGDQATLNLKQTGLAMHSYHDKYNELPPAYLATRDGKPGLSWRVLLLPFLGHNDLYMQFKLDEPWDSPNNLPLLQKMPDVYRSPNDPVGTTDTPYRVFVGKETPFSNEPKKIGVGNMRLTGITDGTSNTIFVVEARTKVAWTKPEELEYSRTSAIPPLGYLHQDRYHVLMGDGSVRVVHDFESPEEIRAAITHNGGEVTSFGLGGGGGSPRRKR